MPVRCCFALGKLYIIGDKENYERGYSNVDVVSLDTGETAEATSMLAPRIDPTVTSSTSVIYTFGGRHDRSGHSSCEMFNTQTAS